MYEVLEDLTVLVERYESDALDDEFLIVVVDPFDFAVSDKSAGYSDGIYASVLIDSHARRPSAGRRSAPGTPSRTLLLKTAQSSVSILTRAGLSMSQSSSPQGRGRRVSVSVGLDVPILVECEQILVFDPPAAYAETYPNLVPSTSMSIGERTSVPTLGAASSSSSTTPARRSIRTTIGQPRMRARFGVNRAHREGGARTDRRNCQGPVLRRLLDQSGPRLRHLAEGFLGPRV